MSLNNETKEFISELKRRRPFDRMDAAHIDWLAGRLDQLSFLKDTVVLVPGVPCDALYFIHRGSIQLEAMGNADEERKVLAELVVGESFPLEALEEHRPVFSTFRTVSDSLCFRLKLEDFSGLKELSSIFADFCRYRAASFLEQSRRVYRLHFSNQSEEQHRLNTPLSLLMQPKPLTAERGWTVREVVAPMYEQDFDATVVVDDDFKPIGIFTIRDLLRNVIVPGMDLYMPIEKAMTPEPKTLPLSALGYEAALLLAEADFHHIVLVDKGRLAGVVTERDLFSLQRVSLTQITSQIRNADNLDWLKKCHRDVHLLAENMIIQGVMADQITQILSSLNDQIACRAMVIELADADMRDVRITWIALGSEGRFEQTITTDQDNAIIFEAPNGMTPDEVRSWLLPMAQRVNKALDHVGFPLCKGNIMAGNPDCCLSFSEWQRRFNKWIAEPTPEALLNATIFFDFRHLSGPTDSSDRLRTWLAGACAGQNRFLNLLMENALQRTPPVGFFRDFVVEDHVECQNSIDLKTSGVTLFVDAARVYALACGITRANTKQRMISAGDLRKWPQSEVNAWADSFSFLQSLRIRHQYELKRGGENVHNRINPYELNNLDRKFFLEALRQAGKFQKQMSSDFGTRMM